MTQNNTKGKLKVIGVTGGVGAGKSAVTAMLKEEFGGAVIIADQAGHDLMEPGAASYQQILQAFGTEILREDQHIDRPALAAIVFSDPEKLRLLNQITHPNIRREILSRIDRYQRERQASFIAVEAALLIEEGYREMLDELWYVYATPENRIKRLMEGRGYTEEKSRCVMARQLSDGEFRRHCDKVIDNNGDLDAARDQIRNALNI